MGEKETDVVIERLVSRERVVNPYAELSHAHWVLLEDLREKKPGWHYLAMSCVAVAAFKTEALVNVVGNRLFPFWKQMETLSFNRKLEAIAIQSQLDLDWGTRPLQTVATVMKARNELAHGKPCVLESKRVERGTREELRRRGPRTGWEELCTLEAAERAYEDTEQFAKDLSHGSGGQPKELRNWGTSYTIHENDEHFEIGAEVSRPSIHSSRPPRTSR